MKPSTKVESLEAQIEIEDKTVDIEISITEGGKIEIDVIHSPKFEPSPEIIEGKLQDKGTLEGTTSDGEKIKLLNAITTFSLKIGYVKIAQISSPKIEIYQNEDKNIEKGTGVKIKFDVLCLKHFHPHNVRDEITLLSQSDWKISASPLSDLDDRIEFVKSYKSPLRTIELNIAQDIPGDSSHQMDEAEKKVDKLLELAGFVQGVGPSYVRAELTSIDGDPVESRDEDVRYKKYYTESCNIGGGFKFGKIVWGDEYQEYLEEAYDSYDNEVRNDLRLNMVIGYYWDALNITRPIEGRFLSVCSAIELLSQRYSDLYETQSGTQEKIEYLIDELDVETADLANLSGTFAKSPSQDYFYQYSRIYVVHGDNNPSQEELRDDFFAALTLLQRIIRNQLLKQSKLDVYDTLSELGPIDVIDFD